MSSLRRLKPSSLDDIHGEATRQVRKNFGNVVGHETTNVLPTS